MYKKIIGGAAVAIIAVGTFLATKTNANGGNTDLSQLVKVNNANAECIGDGMGGCSWLGNCYWYAEDSYPATCDPTQG